MIKILRLVSRTILIYHFQIHMFYHLEILISHNPALYIYIKIYQDWADEDLHYIFYLLFTIKVNYTSMTSNCLAS